MVQVRIIGNFFPEFINTPRVDLLFDPFYPRLVDFSAAMATVIFQFDDIINNSQVSLIMDNPLGS